LCWEGACGCPEDTLDCGFECVDPQTDIFNCGACDNWCTDGTCIAGECSCEAALTYCSGLCVDLQEDSSNCGECDVVCSTADGASGECRNGGCGAPPSELTPSVDATGKVGSTEFGIDAQWLVVEYCMEGDGECMSDVQPPVGDAFPNTGGVLCLSGNAIDLYAGTGPSMQLVFNFAPDVTPLDPYDAPGNGVLGIAFDLELGVGDDVSVFALVEDGPNYFREMAASDHYRLFWDDFDLVPWEEDNGPFDTTAIARLSFEPPPGLEGPEPFEFCVSNFSLIIDG
jgi:hypothetical protein